MISLIWRELSYMHNKEKHYSLIINLYAEMNRENNGWIICGPWYLSFAYCRIGVSSFIVKVYLICIMNFLFAKKERTSKWVCPARYLYTFAQANIYKLRKNENNFFLIYKYRVFYLLIFRIISFFMFAAFKSSKRMRYL